MEDRTNDHRLHYQPALDGLRAVAVAMVLLFHAGFGWMRAGYLGVSIFFTLSGYLITSLLLAEWSRESTIDLGQFFNRRLRRLVPPSLICLVGIVIARSLGEFESVPGLRRELFGAVAHVFNWVRIAGDTSYADVFAHSAATVSPLEHYWSLAIEEQFYLLWPIAILVLARRVSSGTDRRSPAAWRQRMTRLLGGLFGAMTLLALVVAWRFGADVAYWSTPTRLPELLAGATLAAAVLWRPTPSWSGRVAAPALGGLVVLAVVLPSTTGLAYRGALAPVAVITAGLLWSLTGPSRVRQVLAARPMVAVGKVSYGLYLYHWPIFVALRQRGWELDTAVDFFAAMGIVAAVATVSFVAIEQPIRSAGWRPSMSVAGSVAAIAAVAVVIAVVPFSRGFLEQNDAVIEAASAPPADSLVALVPGGPAEQTSGTDVAPSTGATPPTTPTSVTGSSTSVAPTSTTAAPPREAPSDGSTTAGPDSVESESAEPASGGPGADLDPTGDVIVVDVAVPEVPVRPVRLLTIGDSTAFYVGQALAEWAVQHPDVATSDLLWCQGCGFLLDGTITSWDAERFLERSREVVGVELGATVSRVQPDVVALMTTINDVATRQWNDTEGPLDPSDARFANRLEESYLDITADLLDAGVAHVVWIAPPIPDGFVAEFDGLYDADRWAVLHRVIRRVAAAAGPSVTVAEAQQWATATGRIADEQWRSDGTHLTEASAFELVDRWLAPTLVATALNAPIIQR